MSPAEATIARITGALRDERRRQHLTQADLADLLGVSRPYLSELEQGQATKQLTRLIEALHAVGIDLVAQKRQ